MPSYQPGYQPVRWPWLSSVSRNLGIAMCAPVSPPVVVVSVNSIPGCSCEMVTTITLTMVTTVMAPGTHHQREREVVASGAAGPVSGGSCTFTPPGPGSSDTTDRERGRAARDVPASGVGRPHPVYVTVGTPERGLGSPRPASPNRAGFDRPPGVERSRVAVATALSSGRLRGPGAAASDSSARRPRRTGEKTGGGSPTSDVNTESTVRAVCCSQCWSCLRRAAPFSVSK